MVGKLTFLAGAAAGYVLGTKAGRERYDKIVAAAHQATENPKVAQAVGAVTTRGSEILSEAKEKIGDKVPGARGSSEDAGSTPADTGRPAGTIPGKAATLSGSPNAL